MSEKKRGYMNFLVSFEEAIDDLADGAAQLSLYRAIVRYGLYGEIPELTGIAATLWRLIFPVLRANRKQFENGAKGGAPKGVRNNPRGRRQSPEDNPELTQN